MTCFGDSTEMLRVPSAAGAVLLQMWPLMIPVEMQILFGNDKQRKSSAAEAVR
jgi:hypothetical protein